MQIRSSVYSCGTQFTVLKFSNTFLKVSVKLLSIGCILEERKNVFFGVHCVFVIFCLLL